MQKSCTTTKETLLETALELVGRSSYESVGINEICEKAGVTKGCFYHYFDSKAALFQEAVKYCWDQMKPQVDAIFSPDNTALQQLHGIIELIISRQEELSSPEAPVVGCPFMSAGTQSMLREPKVQQAIREATERAINHKIVLVRNLLQEGYLEEEIDALQAAHYIHEFVMGVMLHARSYQDLEILKRDLKQGLYRLLTVKHTFRQ